MFSQHTPLLIIFLVSLVCADNKRYAIWPKDSTDTNGNNIITQNINSRVAQSDIYASESATLGFLFWSAPLTDGDVTFFSNLDSVSSQY